MPLDPSVFVHPRALVETDDIGRGTRVWAFAHVMSGAVVGADCNVGDHAFVESGVVVGNNVTIKNAVLLWDKVTIEDDVFLGPNAVFTNDLVPRSAANKTSEEFLPTLVKRGATIGANATIVCGSTIGEHAFIGAGTVVLHDVPAHALIVGNPGRVAGWVCECGARLPDSLACECGKQYRLVDAQTGLVPA